MQTPTEILNKFPVILRNKLLNKEIEFQDNVMFHYAPIKAYRFIKRKQNDNSGITENDFKSNAELKRKNIKGTNYEDVTKVPEYYGVSFYENTTMLQIRVNLPPQNRKIIEGYIYQEGGPILKGNDTHICWWLYENADISNFTII